MGRRGFLGLAAAGGAALAAPAILAGRGRAQDTQPAPRLLFVLGASGGMSIVDTMLPTLDTEITGAQRGRLIAYPEAAIEQLPGSAFRVVRNLRQPGPFQSDFDPVELVRAHGDDMLVATLENTSVNHVVAQKRAVTGAGIDGGRTLLEAMAMTHGTGMLLPAATMASGGFVEAGDYARVPAAARAEVIADPLTAAASLDGSRGLFRETDPRRLDDAMVRRARAARERLEALSPLEVSAARSELRRRFLDMRRVLQPRIESADLIEKLMLVSNGVGLGDYGLSQSPAIEEMRLLERLPRLYEDRLEAQTALAYLLARYGVSSAVAWGPSFQPAILADGTIADTPIAFDFSHTDHVVSQNVMWSRVAKSVDALVRLLKDTPTDDGTLWDRSLVYVATDFGRSRDRPNGALSGFGSGHHLSNGNLFISPLLRGNRVFGGVRTDSLVTDGFDPITGERTMGRNEVREGHLYSLVCQALGIAFEGRLDMSGLIR